MSNTYTTHDGYAILGIVSPKHGIFQVLVDIEDLPSLQQYRWCIAYEPSRRAGHKYAVRAPNSAGFLARHLMNPPRELLVDHINSNPLDNRRANLRLVTHKGNAWNRVDPRGYCWDSALGRWKSGIMRDGHQIHLGYFDSETCARQAYLDAKANLHQVPVQSIPADTVVSPEDS